MNIIDCKWNKLTVCQPQFHSQKMQIILHDIDSAMHEPSKTLKDDPTSTVVVVTIDEKPVVIKRSNTKGFFHYLRRLVCTSRAQKNWYYAARLAHANIKTFEPIAYIEDRIGPFKKRSYFICSLISGVDALHFFSHMTYQSRWEIVAKNIVELIQQLANECLSHRDLNLSNIILVGDEPYLIDLDSMRQYRWSHFTKWATHHQVKRFMENWQDYPEISRQVVKMFTRYFQARGLMSE